MLRRLGMAGQVIPCTSGVWFSFYPVPVSSLTDPPAASSPLLIGFHGSRWVG